MPEKMMASANTYILRRYVLKFIFEALPLSFLTLHHDIHSYFVFIPVKKRHNSLIPNLITFKHIPND